MSKARLTFFAPRLRRAAQRVLDLEADPLAAVVGEGWLGERYAAYRALVSTVAQALGDDVMEGCWRVAWVDAIESWSQTPQQVRDAVSRLLTAASQCVEALLDEDLSEPPPTAELRASLATRRTDALLGLQKALLAAASPPTMQAST